MHYIISGFLLLLPFTSEAVLNEYKRTGNMGLYGLHLEIYYSRNIFYLSCVSLPIFHLYNYTYYGVILSILSFFLFLVSCYKWKGVLSQSSH